MKNRYEYTSLKQREKALPVIFLSSFGKLFKTG
jgi:hypothetical protein